MLPGYEFADTLGSAGAIVGHDHLLDECVQFDLSWCRHGAHEGDPLVDCVGREARTAGRGSARQASQSMSLRPSSPSSINE